MAESKIRVSMILDAKEFVEGMNAAGVSVDQLGKNTEKANEKTGSFSSWLAGGVAGLVAGLTTKILDLAKSLGEGLVQGAKAAVEAFTGFERSMRNVNSIAQESEDGFKKTSQAVLDLSIELGKSPTGLADALFDINSAGVSGSKALDMVKESARLAEAGLTDTKTAAGALLTAMQLYGDELGTTANAADKFSKANEIGRTTIGELSKEFGRVATTAKTAGVSFNETMAAMAALTLAGQETNLAATNLNAAFTEIIKPSETLAETFEGITGKSIQAYTAQNGLVGTLKALYEITGGSTEQLGKLGLSQSALSAIAGLASNNFKTFDDAIQSVGKSTGTLDNQLAQQQMTLAKAIEKWNALKEVILIQIGEKLAPVLAHLIDIAMQMGEAVNEWLKNKDNVAKLNELIDAAKIAIDVVLMSLKELATVFTEAFKTGADGAEKAGTAIDTLVGLLKLVAVAVNVVLSYLKPVVEILGDMGRVLSALSEHKWGEAMKASAEMAKDSIFALPKATIEATKAIIESGDKLKDATAKQEEEKTAKAQAEAAKRAEAAAKANQAILADQKATSEQTQHFQAIDVDAFKESLKNKGKAAKEAQKEAIELVKEEYKAKKDADTDAYNHSMATLKQMAIGANKYQKEMIAHQKILDQERHRDIQDALDKELAARIKAIKAGTDAHADGMGKQTAAQADASAKQGKSIAEFVSKANSDLDSMTSKDREAKVRTTLNGKEQLEMLDKLKDGKIQFEMDWDKLNQFLLSTVHKDYAVMIDHLAAIRTSNQAIVEKIPPAAASF